MDNGSETHDPRWSKPRQMARRTVQVIGAVLITAVAREAAEDALDWVTQEDSSDCE
ncbi:hypothetical protein ACPCSL_34210 [Streptomyces griseoincarnatus]|uniref:Uncharacterized protein n=3 Tax=Streptomyces TaxID=1883 RepID=A0A6G3R0X0_9ACTN|nr:MULTISPECIES: hypothetical protein [unclassified Streptomyces]NEA89398.1 hypothetical protein [Streptomyces sp. SID14436]NEC81620.1 hypothetical protein [Streptomyces sp. SID7958]